MIVINSFCIGNKEKSFYLDNFSNGVNIIHSDDNNKGKTIVSQGILYALGNAPIFPKGFDDYQDYYFIINLNKDDKNIYICRKNDYFLVFDNQLLTFDSVNEFKRYFNENICSLPVINKNGIRQMAGLELFFEMFFLPQDKRQTSNICNRGRYTKDDYIECIYSLMNCENPVDLKQEEKIKIEIQKLETQQKILKNSNKFLKSKKLEARFTTYTVSKSFIDEKFKEIEKCKAVITDLNNTKNRMVNRKTQNELLLKEIASLNREFESGTLVCLECGSDKIAYNSTGSAIKFEISDVDIRNEIKKTIENRIQICLENILDLDSKIAEKQQELSKLMADDNVNLENLIFYKNDIIEASKIDKQIFDIEQNIQNLKDKINKFQQINNQNKNTRQEIYNRFIDNMNYFYNSSEPEDPLTITEIFTKNDVNYSGSQGTLYLMSRIYACSKLLNIDFPIVIDHFRGGEISSFKEENIINLFDSLNKQIIFTCTLKKEEYNKYINKLNINDISFDNVVKFHLLQEKDNQIFRKLLQVFSINIDIQE